MSNIFTHLDRVGAEEALGAISQLRATPSSKEKEQILKQYSDSKALKQALYATYSPRLNYFIATLPEISDEVCPESTVLPLPSLLMKLSSREITGNSARDHVICFLEHSSEPLKELLALIIARDFDCGVGAKTINKVFKGLIEEIPYQRCSKLDEKTSDKLKWHSGVLVQLKADGVFTYIVKPHGELPYLVTRNGTVARYEPLDEVFDIDSEFVILGEALVERGGEVLSRKEGNGLINSFMKKGTDIDGTLVFQVWDMIEWLSWNSNISDDRPYHERLSLLLEQDLGAYITALPTTVAFDLESAQAVADGFITEGFEGAIAKNPDAVWKSGTSKDLVKFKAIEDADLICVGTTPHSKDETKIGALICETSCGNLRVNIGTGLTDALRQKPPDHFIGKVVEVQYNELIQSKSKETWSMFLPRFIELRFDKDSANTLGELR